MNKVVVILISSVLFFSCNKGIQEKNTLAHYNISWDSQSTDASESMPLVGGDIGCNVWVENEDLLLYVQRSGSLTENGEYLKMGRFRIRLNPNPFVGDNSFRQELKLEDGFIEIESKKGETQNVLIQLWVDVFRPVVNIDIESAEPTEAQVSYESWRTENKELKAKGPRLFERFTCFSLDGYPGKVIRVKDEIEHFRNGVLFYHRNPKNKLIPDVLIEQQGLEEYSDEIFDDIRNRTFGGYVFGKGLISDGTGEGRYQITPFRSWRLKSENPQKHHKISIVTHIEQAESINDWKTNLFETVEGSERDRKQGFETSKNWWNNYWKRSYIVINPDNPEPDNPVWQTGRNYQLFRYQLGGNIHGEYPTKFNGGNLNYDPVLMGDQ